MPLRPLAVAACVTIALGVAAPLGAQAALGAPQSTRVAAAAAHALKAAAKRPPKSGVLYGINDHWEPQMEADDHKYSARSGIVGTFLDWSSTKPGSIINYAHWARSRGSVPMVDLHPPRSATLASIAAGRQDHALIADAKALHKWNHPFLFRLFPEMNGRWESYSPGTRHQTARQFVRAWRHVYRLFRSHHASKVMFVWNPDKELSRQYTSFRHLWPGKGYVNWIGLDVFNEQDATHGTFPSPKTALAPSVHAIRRFSGKPLMIPEIGVANYAGKPGWIRTALGKMSRLGFKAVVWYNEASAYANGTPVNWRLDSSSAALRATRHTLAGKAVVWPGHNGGRLARDEKMILHGHW
jgi:Glycosyl hydrolase family 26